MLEQCCKYSKPCRNNVATLCCAKNRCCESYRVTSPLRLLPPRKGIQIQEIGETFNSGIWNLRNFQVLKPCVIRYPKRGVRNPTNDGIRNPSFTENESGIQSLESGLQSVESKIQLPIYGGETSCFRHDCFPRVSKLQLCALRDLFTNRSLGNTFDTINFPRRISKEKNMETDGHN